MAMWQNDLQDWNHRVTQYRQAHPWYVPTLSDWVDPETWRRISEDLLDSEDQTDGGSPNDVAVESLLRREGRYADKEGERGKVIHAEPLEQLEHLKWEIKPTHVEAYEAYMTKWGRLMRTMLSVQKPPAKKQALVMADAVQPAGLRKRIKAKLWDGLGPHKLSKVREEWRVKAPH